MTLCMESFALILLPFWILLVPAAKPWPLSNLLVSKLQLALTNVGRNGMGNYISNAWVVLLVDWLLKQVCRSASPGPSIIIWLLAAHVQAKNFCSFSEVVDFIDFLQLRNRWQSFNTSNSCSGRLLRRLNADAGFIGT